MTVAGLVGAYLADPEKAALRSSGEIQRRLCRNVVPVIGAVKITELRRRDVRNVTDAMLRRGVKVEATRVFEDVRGMVRWAVENEYLDANPLDGMSKPAEATSSNRVLSDDEIAPFGTGSRSAGALVAVSADHQAVPCDGAAGRRGGGHDARRAGSGRARMADPRSRRRTVTPMSCRSPTLRSRLSRRRCLTQGRAVRYFLAVGGRCRRWRSRARSCGRTPPSGCFGIASWSAHDLRRTALTQMARLGVSPIVLGHVANHRTTTRAGVTLAVYSQYTYDPEKRAALELWADRLAAITGAGTVADVLPFGRSA